MGYTDRMTHLCYTLEEAATHLNLSETVLVRLSQYFKVPKSAYEPVGYLSFKGDLLFDEQDMTFFRKVKERLLAGEGLDEVKSRMRREESHSVTDISQPLAQPAPPVPSPQAEEPSPPIPTLQDEAPYKNAAQRNFERYKSTHHTGLTKVFENMIKEVGKDGGRASSDKSNPKTSVHTPVKPLRGRAVLPEAPQPEARLEADILPFKRRTERPTNHTPKPAGNGAGWEQALQDAINHPRALNARLKNAAMLLRDRALEGEHHQERHPN